MPLLQTVTRTVNSSLQSLRNFHRTDCQTTSLKSFSHLLWLSYISPWLVVQSLNCVRLFATPWTVACQAPLSMKFPREEYWSGFLFPSPGVVPDRGINPMSPASQADSLLLSHQGSPRLSLSQLYLYELDLTFMSVRIL